MVWEGSRGTRDADHRSNKSKEHSEICESGLAVVEGGFEALSRSAILVLVISPINYTCRRVQ